MPACARRDPLRPASLFLLGKDPLTGNDYIHRRSWVEDRLQLLVASFSIDVAFLALSL